MNNTVDFQKTYNKLFELSLNLLQHNVKAEKEDQNVNEERKVKSKLASKCEMIEEFEVYKLNCMSTIGFLEEEKKKN